MSAAAVSDRDQGADEASTACLYAVALAGAVVNVRSEDGTLRPLASSRWLGPARDADLSMLDRARAPVLDVGCGPGRLVAELVRRRIGALGIDVAPTAVRMTHLAGGLALRRCVFEPLPATGRWRTVLLADGNVGIGGDPQRLLRRVRELLQPDGQVLLELAPPGGGTRRHHVRLECGNWHGPWFWWSQVPDDEVPAVCADAGLVATERWQVTEAHRSGSVTRWFAAAQLAA